MKTLNHYTLTITDRRGIIKDDRPLTCTPLPILAENDEYLVLDNRRYDTIAKKYREYCAYAMLDRPTIGLYTNDSVWGNRVDYSLYTSKTKRPATIRKEIEAAIQKKFGFFLHGINLDTIEETACTL